MANYYGQARTNYFRVKDEAAFHEWCGRYEISTHPGADGTHTILAETEDGSFPYADYEEETGEWIDIDFFSELSKHLAEGEVAIAQTTGSEKLRYLVGVAQAVNSEGDFLEINIDDIYDLVREKWGVNPTVCEY
jgi:hypothetical protein